VLRIPCSSSSSSPAHGYAIIRFRRRAGDAGREPLFSQVYGSTQIELAWTVVPFLIVDRPVPHHDRLHLRHRGALATSDALEVTIVGNQWWWEIRYPGLGIVTANELHVPVSDPADRGRPSSRCSPPTSSTASGSPSSPARRTSSQARPTGRGSTEDAGDLRRAVRRVLRTAARRHAAHVTVHPKTTSPAGVAAPAERRPPTSPRSGPGVTCSCRSRVVNCHSVRARGDRRVRP